MVYSLLYNVFLVVAAVVLSPLLAVWLLMVPKTRAGFWEKLGKRSPTFESRLAALPESNRIWLHAVSVGELNAARPLIRALKAKGYPLIISTTTATGNALAHKTYPELPIFYFPFDFPWVIEATLHRLNPAVLVILETEIWPNLLHRASQNRVPVLLVNGRLSSRSFTGYHRFKWFFGWVLTQYTALLMQSAADAQRIRQLGVDEAKVSAPGNLKFDLMPVDSTDQQAQLAALFQFPAKAPVLVFASTHKGEDEIFIRMFDALRLDFPDLRAVLAPRHPERVLQVVTMLNAHGAHFTQRSQLRPEAPNHPETPVILLDTIGELNAVFALATVACMGGTFVEWGGHNPLEPINAGIPVVFGPSMENFEDVAHRVLEAHAGFQVQSAHDAEQQIRELLTRPEYYTHIVRNGQRLMAENRGVTQTLVSHIEACLTQASEPVS